VRTSKLFATDARTRIEGAILEIINGQPEFLSARAAMSTRGVGDELQAIVSENLEAILKGKIGDYVGQFERRALADIAFTDSEGLYYAVDVKTHRLDTKFNMPNVTSVRRIAEFYSDDKNVFVTLIIRYSLNATRVLATQVHFAPIEFLSWDCLRIGALGLGQIQIKNANRVELLPGNSRREWMLELCDRVVAYHESEQTRIERQRQYFERVRRSWLEREA
jgi:hypothetical protein